MINWNDQREEEEEEESNSLESFLGSPWLQRFFSERIEIGARETEREKAESVFFENLNLSKQMKMWREVNEELGEFIDRCNFHKEVESWWALLRAGTARVRRVCLASSHASPLSLSQPFFFL